MVTFVQFSNHKPTTHIAKFQKSIPKHPIFFNSIFKIRISHEVILSHVMVKMKKCVVSKIRRRRCQNSKLISTNFHWVMYGFNFTAIIIRKRKIYHKCFFYNEIKPPFCLFTNHKICCAMLFIKFLQFTSIETNSDVTIFPPACISWKVTVVMRSLRYKFFA